MPYANPCRGHDAPTPAREWDLLSHGALTLFFRWRKKSVQKKASGTATPGKSPLLPILTAGLAMSRAAQLNCQHGRSCALGARLFPPPKWAGLFPSAAYRRSAPPQVALGRLKGKPVGMLRRNLAGFAAKKQACFFHYGWHYAYSISIAWDASSRPGYSCNTKCQRYFISTLVFVASHEARCRMAAFSIQQTRKPHQTGEPRGPSPSGGKTPAKPHVLRVPPRPMGRGVGCRAARGSGCPVDTTAAGG